MSYYECHITMEGNKEFIEPCVAALGWKFSAIDGDTVFGVGVKCYATNHFNIKKGDDEVLRELNTIADILVAGGIKVTRRKIEKVIFDDRSSKVRFDDQDADQDGNYPDRADQGTQ